MGARTHPCQLTCTGECQWCITEKKPPAHIGPEQALGTPFKMFPCARLGKTCFREARGTAKCRGIWAADAVASGAYNIYFPLPFRYSLSIL
jgi:hypothetical protein